VKQRDEELIRQGYESLPEAKPFTTFEDVWHAYNESCEYCGSRSTLREILDHIPSERWGDLYRDLAEEVAGSWSYELAVEEAEQAVKREERQKGIDDTSAALALLRAASALAEIAGGGKAAK
jgi:hypothetical protein